MQSGQLNTYAQLYQQTDAKDDWGQSVDTWSLYANVWGGLRYLTGKEFITADKQAASVTASFRIRPLSVDTTMRLHIDSRVFEITAVLPGRDWVDLTIKEVV